ncbi:MAG: bifunctional 5,10-methylenetetrahydrofolate dehydrogenase/5,10-methenyltetrahydrofolate cyclohydrolase [Candidatus Lindowbacteria bacterium]|nr:bifunctional 5,10-methylenetetrahydrofolate dehydrogenase/5,10-methenyltetrahydrofolate cyclohydrolase [Candidatus Lindowbacteria bacterium]
MILAGGPVANKLKKELIQKVAELKRRGITPGLTAIRVGSDPASELYVSRKIMACEEVGIESRSHILSDDVTDEELLELIRKENEDSSTHGILVQLPLPATIDTQAVIEAVAPEKDVDGFHPFNVGRVSTNVGGFAPCTPKGIMKILDFHGLDCRGKDVVVVGASNIVGKPLARLMLAKEATVTTCHIETKDVAEHTRRADILVVCAGRPSLVTKDMVKKGVILIDVGVNRVPDSSSPRGFRVVGDIASAARDMAYAYTPVPGGIGPMTVAMLLENTIIAAEAIDKGIVV